MSIENRDRELREKTDGQFRVREFYSTMVLNLEKEVRELLNTTELKQYEVSNLVGLSVQSLSKILNNKIKKKTHGKYVDNLLKIKEKLGKKPE